MFTAGLTGRSRQWQEGDRERDVQVPEEGFTAGIAGSRDSGRREAGKGMYKYLEKGSLQE